MAIARAVAIEPRLVLADQPTGNLDPAPGSSSMNSLQEISRERIVIVVMHAEDLARLADHVIHIRDGHIFEAAHARARVAAVSH